MLAPFLLVGNKPSRLIATVREIFFVTSDEAKERI